MEQDKRAWFDIPVKLTYRKDHYDETELVFSLENRDMEYFTNLTDKQKKNLADQIAKLVSGKKFVIRSAIECPNCETQVDETDTPNVYVCSKCSLKMTLEPKKK